MPIITPHQYVVVGLSNHFSQSVSLYRISDFSRLTVIQDSMWVTIIEH